jgi:predicted nucleic acid-binding protein
MIVLDTNVVSAMMRRDVDTIVRDWLDSLPSESIWVTTITIFEVRFGIEILAKGRRRAKLEDDFAQTIAEDFQGRVLDLDQTAAATAGLLAARRKLHGRPIEMRDTMIAGIIVSRRAQFATRNVRHFEDLDISVINPWATRSP